MPDASIAIIGMAFRFPGDVRDTSGMWAMLSGGKCCISRIPSWRWPVEELQHPDRSEPGRSVTFAAGALSGIENFDAAFFGISPREAAWMDPQQRLLLQMAYEAMEDAGVRPSSLAGSDCGVYVGISGMDYGQHALEDLSSMTGHSMTGNTLSIASNRLSYVFDLHGPSVSMDTACSSSLVALHHACAALRSGEVPLALAGGVNLLMHPYSFIGFSKASMLSAGGRCRPFDAGADGYVRAEGGAVLLLKPLKQARKDGDRIHAVILSSGVNADGSRKSGLTIPSADAQAELMASVLAESGLSADDIDFIEAHGTGTPVGDPVEAESIGRVFGRGRNAPMPISSVKANVGHLEPASGMAGLVKAVLTLQHGELPPMPLEFTPNPHIDFHGLNVSCAAAGMQFRHAGRRLAAGVNSFGFGGVNAHVLLQEGEKPAPRRRRSVAVVPPLLLGARSEEALRALAGAYAARLEADPAAFYDMAWGAAYHRDRMELRLTAVGDAPADIAAALRAYAAGEAHEGIVTEHAVGGDGDIAFVYTGNGAQWLGMGRGLYAQSPVFAATLRKLDRLVRPLAGFSLLKALNSDDPETLADTTICQPLLFAVQVGLTAMLAKQGIRPHHVAGHSVGEVVAAWAAGALTLEQAVQVICARSYAQAKTRGAGRMAAAGLSAVDAAGLIRELRLDGELELAGVNSAGNVMLAGSPDALARVRERLKRQGVFFRELDLDYAFHSRAMEPVRGVLAEKLAGLTPSPAGNAEFVSTVTGQAMAGEALDGAYWWRNVRRPVRFSDAISKLVEGGCRIFVEIGPHAILQRYIREHLPSDGRGRVFPTLLRGDDNPQRMRNLACRLHLLSDRTDLKALFPVPGNFTELPKYPWQGQKCLYPRTGECRPEMRRVHPLLGWPLDGVDPAWENVLDPAKDVWLNDHVVDGAVVFAGACYAEMALAAARARQGGGAVALESLDILLPLAFEHGQSVRCRLDPADGSIRIYSRPRLGTGDWVLHAKARAVAPGRAPSPVMKALPAACARMDATALYARTERLGLSYGPAFRVIEHVRMEGDRLDAALAVRDSRGYVLPPASLDACFHALAALYDDTACTAFLPVRTGRLDRYADGAVASIRARMRRGGRRSLAADFELFDAEGRLVARALDCRFRAFPSARAAGRGVAGWQVRPWFRPLPGAGALDFMPSTDILAGVADGAAGSDARRGLWYKQVLPACEAMVLTAAASAFRALESDGPDRLESLHGPYARWLSHLLREEGLLIEESGRCRITADAASPSLEELWGEAARRAPEALPALLRVGRVARHLEAVLRGELDGPALLRDVEESSVARGGRVADMGREGIQAALDAVLRHIARLRPAQHKMRVLESAAFDVGSAGALAGILAPDCLEYVLALPEGETLLPANREHPAVRLAHVDPSQGLPAKDQCLGAPFDVIVFRHTLHSAGNLPEALAQARGLLAPGGLLLVAENHPDWSADFIEGLDPQWWHGSAAAPASSLLRPVAWQRLLEEQGFTGCRTYTEPAAEGLDEGTYLLLAKAPADAARPEEELPRGAWLLLADAASRDLAENLRVRLVGRGLHAAVSDGDMELAAGTGHVVFMRGFADAPDAAVPTLDALLRCARECAARENNAPHLWIVTCGGALAAAPAGGEARPAQCAVTGLGRVIQSECGGLPCTLLDVPDAGAGAAGLLEQELLHADGASEALLTAQGRYVSRVAAAPDDAAAPVAGDRCRLDFAAPGRLDNLEWRPDAERELAGGEVEARVMAVGLNFRDVMLTMGLLPDDAVENGFAGPNLGLEFAGEITRVGADADLKVGDKVLGFAPSCFAGHVVTPSHTLVPMPGDWSFASAATVPTVFLTAWYALHYLAHLAPGERVLIHGAAGGVGQAAIQIARHLGAEIFATAGSEEKRDFLRLLGVEHIFDSRSLTFADEVLAATGGQGVDVVLNSLAGEAMRRSAALLRPFGRFLELGKRDFVENTTLGLRPFKENVSYFAIDVDQLLTARPQAAAQCFREVMSLFRDGVLTPLPYRSFPAADVVEAFRAMQQARHIGKIVVSMAGLPPVQAPASAPSKFDAQGAWLVTGGLSGFGLATARHLAARGVRQLVLAGRRGNATPGAADVLEEFRAMGVDAVTEACDIADATAVRALVERIAASGRELRGIVHAAAVFDDMLLDAMDAQALERVLAPKLAGAWHLHKATRHLPLKYFVLYSSISVALGNPGQGNYVAANAGLEGLARLRRSMGLPAVCVAWGPVGDAGYLTRHEKVKKSLSQCLGKPPLTAERAMACLDAALAADPCSSPALSIFADVDWDRVAGMSGGDRYVLVAREGGHARTGGSDGDFRQLLEGKEPEEIVALVQACVTEELAHVLGLDAAQVAQDRSVQSMGLDSLMAVELAVGLEQRTGVRLPAMMLQDSPTVAQIAQRVSVRLVGRGEDSSGEEAMLTELARQHAEDLSADDTAKILRQPEGATA